MDNLILSYFYMCSYIVFIQMPTWDKWSQTSSSLTCPKKLHKVDIGEAWQGKLYGSLFKDTGRNTAFLLNPDLNEWEWTPGIQVMKMMNDADNNFKKK